MKKFKVAIVLKLIDEVTRPLREVRKSLNEVRDLRSFLGREGLRVEGTVHRELIESSRAVANLRKELAGINNTTVTLKTGEVFSVHKDVRKAQEEVRKLRELSQVHGHVYMDTFSVHKDVRKTQEEVKRLQELSRVHGSVDVDTSNAHKNIRKFREEAKNLKELSKIQGSVRLDTTDVHKGVRNIRKEISSLSVVHGKVSVETKETKEALKNLRELSQIHGSVKLNLSDVYKDVRKVQKEIGGLSKVHPEISLKTEEAEKTVQELKELSQIHGQILLSDSSLKEGIKEARRLRELSQIHGSVSVEDTAIKSTKEKLNELTTTSKIHGNLTVDSSSVQKATREVRELTKTTREATRETSRLTRVVETLKENWQKVKKEAGGALKDISLAVASFKGAQITASVTADLVMPAADIQTALGEVASVGVKNLELLKETALKVSSEWSGVTAPDFIRSAYDVKSAISTLTDEGVAKYTEFAAVTAKATKATVSEMTNLFAVSYGIYKQQFKELSDIEFGEILSAEITKAVQLFRTTGSQMREAIKNLGATATQLGVSIQEQFAVLGILQQTTPGSEAGTSYKYFVQSIITAGEKLGIEVTDANGKLLSMVDIIGQLKEKFGETLEADEVAELKKALGSDEAVKTLMLLWNKTELLKSGIKELTQAQKEGLAYTKKVASTMNQGFNEQLQILSQSFSNLKAVLGFALIPLIIPVVKGITALVKSFAGLMQAHPIVAKTIAVAILGSAVFLTFLSAFLAIRGAIHIGRISLILFRKDLELAILRLRTFALSGIRTAVLSLRWLAVQTALAGSTLKSFAVRGLSTALFFLRNAFLAAAGGVRVLTTALLTNPITLIITAIAFAGYLIYKHWKSVKEFLSDTFNAISQGFRKLLKVFLYLNPITTPILAFKKLYSYLKSINLYSVGKEILKGLAKGLMDSAALPIKVIKDVAGGIVSKVKKFFGIKSPSKVFMEIGYFLTEGLGKGFSVGIPELEKLKTLALKVLVPPIPTLKPIPIPETRGLSPKEKTEKPSITQVIHKIEISLNLPAGTTEEMAKRVVKEVQRQLERQAIKAELSYDNA